MTTAAKTLGTELGWAFLQDPALSGLRSARCGTLQHDGHQSLFAASATVRVQR